MPVISEQRIRDRHEAFLAAARSVFAEKGYERASISDIAAHAGISDGLVYKYFKNKRDLLLSVLTEFYERILTRLERVAEEQGFANQLEALIRCHLDVFVSDTGLCRLFISEVRVSSDYQGSAIQDLNRRYTSVLLKIVEAAKATGEIRPELDARLFRDLIFGAIEHRAWRYVSGRGKLDPARTSRELAAILLTGVVLGKAA